MKAKGLPLKNCLLLLAFVFVLTFGAPSPITDEEGEEGYEV